MPESTRGGTGGAPAPGKKPHTLVAHGDTREDPYYWLRDAEDPAVTAHLKEENLYTQSRAEHTAALRETLFEEIKSRILQTDLSLPVLDGPWWYYARTVEGLQYPIHCRRYAPLDDMGRAMRPTRPLPEDDALAAPGEPDGEIVLLDENELAGDSEYFALGVCDISLDHRLLAYSTDFTGAELYTMWVKDLDTGAILDGPIENTYYGFAWTKDSSALYFTRTDPTMRPYQLWRHARGTTSSADNDTLVLEESDQRFYLGVGTTKDEEYIVVETASRTSSEIHVLDAADPDASPRLVHPRRDDVESSLEHHRGSFIILTNDDAVDFRIVTAPADSPSRENWVDVVPHIAGRRLEGFDVFADHLVVFERSDACARMRVIPRAEAHWDVPRARDIPQPEDVSTVWDGDNPDFASTVLRYGYSSMVTPPSAYDYDMVTGERTLLKVQPVLGGYDKDLYATERRWATSPDGTRVPMSLVYRRATLDHLPAPTLLYGYGSYEASMDPTFSSVRLSLLDRGFVYAIAHVRGGGEMGRHWYDDGKLMAKKHTFEDFVACARHLVDGGTTTPSLLAIRGGSAGGLLMGAVLNMAPDLFGACVAEVPFVDCLTTILDETLPLTVNEWEEWGNPVDDPDVYSYMKQYSPYDNVVPGRRYPPVLATGGLHDPRVSYWEPAKWVARLRDSDPANDALLKMEMGAGHQGPSGRYDAWKDEAFVLAFVLDALSQAPQAASTG